MASFPELVEEELSRARSLHPRPYGSLHEGYAVLLEEVEEVWAEIKKKKSQRDPDALRAELVQVATVCQRMAEDRKLLF